MLASRQPIVASVRRDAWVEVDLGAIEYNIKAVRSWLQPHTKLLAVVKSDAYGHGAAGVAQLLAASGADWLGVASVDEGCQLRAAGVTQPILPSWSTAGLEAFPLAHRCGFATDCNVDSPCSRYRRSIPEASEDCQGARES